MDLKEDEILGEAVNDHWYYRSKARALKKYIELNSYNKVLDVGAGSGFFSKYLLCNSNTSEAMCVDTGYDNNRSERLCNKLIRFEKNCEKYDADLVLLMDVLEHVDNDVGLLKQYMAVVPEGAYFMITVPAFEFMWSGHDVFLEHKRRYNLKKLEATAKEAGLTICSSSYYFGGVFPLAIITRALEKLLPDKSGPATQLRMHSWMANKILYLICLIELAIIKYNKLAGLSVFCLAKK